MNPSNKLPVRKQLAMSSTPNTPLLHAQTQRPSPPHPALSTLPVIALTLAVFVSFIFFVQPLSRPHVQHEDIPQAEIARPPAVVAGSLKTEFWTYN